jgi:hypothetical protein
MTYLESALCAMENPTKEPPTRMRANIPRPMPRLATLRVQAVQPCHHLGGSYVPSSSNSANWRESSRKSNSSWHNYA